MEQFSTERLNKIDDITPSYEKDLKQYYNCIICKETISSIFFLGQQKDICVICEIDEDNKKKREESHKNILKTNEQGYRINGCIYISHNGIISNYNTRTLIIDPLFKIDKTDFR